MPIKANKLLVLVILLLLGACSGGEDRQAKYFTKAQQLFEQKDYEKARIEAKNVLQINSDHVAARYLLALLHEQEKNWQQMYANLNLVIKLDPNHVPARIKLAQMLFANSKYNETLGQLDAVLAQDAEHLDALALRAAVYFRNNDYESALATAQDVLSKHPGHVEAISVLSMVYAEKDPDRALAVIGDGIKQQTGDASLKLIKIDLLKKQQRSGEVIKTYRQLIEQFPKNLLYQYRFVRYLEQIDRIDEAETVLRNILNVRSENVELKLWLVQFLANNRNPELAETTLKEFITRQPKLYNFRFGLGKLYTVQQKYGDAREVYQAVIALDDKGADGLLARNRLAELALLEKIPAQAERLLEDVFAIEPENKEALLTRGRMYLNNKDIKSAITDLRTVLRNAPKSIIALKLLAQAHESDGARKLALDNYRQVLQIAPVDDEATYHAARLAFADGEYEVAENLLIMLARRQPDNPEVFRKLVATYGKQNRWPQAHLEADKLIKEEKTAGLGHYLKGRLYFDQKDYSSAADSFEQALLYKPAAVEGLQFLVKARQSSGHQELAEQYVRKHVERYPKHVHALELLGDLQQQKGELADAREFYKKVIEMEPARSSAYRHFASSYASQGQWQQALVIYEQGVSRNPLDAGLLMSLAALRTRMDSFDAAIETYEKVLELDPGHVTAANNLAVALVDYRPTPKNLARARALSEPLLSKNRNPVFLDTLGWVHYKLGNTTQALNLLIEAVQLGGGGAVYHYHLGMAYFSNNQHSLAKQQLTLALQDENENYVGKEEAELTIKSLL